MDAKPLLPFGWKLFNADEFNSNGRNIYRNKNRGLGGKTSVADDHDNAVIAHIAGPNVSKGDGLN